MATRDKLEEKTQASLQGIDPLLQHRVRLGICALLAGTTTMSFSKLKGLLEETDGNLGAQLRKLEESGYLTVRKEFADRKPVSWYSLTGEGRTALKAHLNAMKSLLGLVPEEPATG